MAAHPIVVVGDGIVEIPESYKDDPRYRRGAKLELVPVADMLSSVDVASKPKGDWRRLKGIFKDASVNLNEELRKDRSAE